MSHGAYYGRVDIGFRAGAIYDAGFNPVLYVTYDNLLSLLAGNASARQDYSLDSEMSFEEDESLAVLIGHLFAPAFGSVVGRLGPFIEVAEFSIEDSDTVYREREWRHIGDFHFAPEHVAAVIVPEQYAQEVQDDLRTHGYPASTAVIPWEFIRQC